jgi:hypothetical protein
LGKHTIHLTPGADPTAMTFTWAATGVALPNFQLQ